MTTVRRCAAALAASAVLCVAVAPAAVAGGDVPPAAAPSRSASSTPSPSPAAPEATATPEASATPAPVVIPPGLYGETDPAYDGVWRQSLALLGQFTGGVRPADQAVAWLKGQQCANGAFPAYRADPATACDALTTVDSNSTAAAVQALSTLGGQRVPMDRAIEWLRSVQNQDGGWGYTPGTPSDANSTSLVTGALTVAGVRPSSMRSATGKNAYDALVSLSIPCDAGTPGAADGEAAGSDDAGAFAYQPDTSGRLTANADATAAAVLAGVGKRMVTGPVDTGPAPSCVPMRDLAPERAARNGAAYLAAALAKTGHLDQPPMPGAADSAPVPDPGNTADAIVALMATGYGNQATGALEWLKANSGAWAQENGPAAYAQLIFAAHATGTDPRNFGGIDLVQRLNETGPAPKSVASASASAVHASGAGSGSGLTVLWLAGIALVICVAAGFLISGRGKTQHR
ncbi:prenyltransferase/squalene oxidase repeat-containing protein [Streptomyces sp. AK02-01A]|uniref:prenyltransferase/squalene oxidase repeat-containing protein n=1 Tax=Streptomyces sp. AK02-01A TaxID=3028648 RepID=UPI0029B8CA31|nr:prenyltransferase/squalene oxidase repeat-containing protein [Streptomyces sp. AK02-01A]MDX3849620.1 terpene cyclase/mutase family protein [Streptomyces sp. AK02-01A]MDX3849810.1 terpene cyclase/mutase family protein [Streptomyces sp. AK02-01A]